MQRHVLYILITLGVITLVYQVKRKNNYSVLFNIRGLDRNNIKIEAQNVNPNYRQYFKNKHVTDFGVYPLLKGHNQTVVEREKSSKIPSKFYRTASRSFHNYKWILNPTLFCVEKLANEQDEIYLLVAVASAIWEFERRDIIRKTWGSVKLYKNKLIKYVFFVGYMAEHETKINKEALKHGDIVMESFSETYRNLTLKTQGQLKWITYFCPNAKFILHVDDDVVPNMYQILSQLVELPIQNTVLCAKWFTPVVRREGKWEMSMEEYRNDRYPLSCYGWCYAMSVNAATDLYLTSLRSALIHLEDVMFTGILRTRLGMGIVKMKEGEQLCQHKGWPKDRPTNEKLVDAWTDLQKFRQALIDNT